jgi:hypothetical protein
MKIDERVKTTLEGFPKSSRDDGELTRLQNFLQQMKDAGIARTREYDLPQPDTLSRPLITRARRPFDSTG